MQQQQHSRNASDEPSSSPEYLSVAQWADAMQSNEDFEFYRVDISLKQRLSSDLCTVRTREELVNVRVRPRRFTLDEAANFACYEFLSDQEVRRIGVRIAMRLDRYLYGNRARTSRKRLRKRRLVKDEQVVRIFRRVPRKMPALVCEHDRGTRRHLHCLFGKPKTLGDAEFRRLVYRVLHDERFVYRRHWIERVKNLAASVSYNANPTKSNQNDPVCYIYPQTKTGELDAT
jgi:hypothetical protein